MSQYMMSKLGFLRNSLIFKILSVIVLTTVLAVIIILTYSTIVTSNSVVGYAKHNLEIRLNNFSILLNEIFGELNNNLSTIAKDPATSTALQSKNKLSSNEVLRLANKNWQQLFVADSEGSVVATNTNATVKQGDNVFANPSYSNFASMKAENKRIAATEINDKQSVSYLEPIYATNGNLVGYVGGSYDLQKLNQLLTVGPGDRIYILDVNNNIVMTLGNGKLVNSTAVQQAAAQASNTGKTYTSEQGDFVVIGRNSTELAKQQIKLAAVLDTEPILSDIREFRLKVYYAAAAALILVNVLMILYLRRLIVKPLDNMKDVAQQIAAGNYEKRVAAGSRGDVIGRLQYAINDMAMSLINEHYNLEEKVDAQTKQLSNKVHDLEEAKKATVNVLDDLSKAKNEIEVARNKDEALLSSIGDGVFALDKDGKIILFNKAASKITGFSASDVIGKQYDTVLKFVVRANDKKPNFVEKSLDGRTASMPRTTYVKHKKGGWVPIADSSSPVLENNKVTGAIVVFRDITKELEVETAKNEFVSLASHQLRTPLTAIGWYTELLLKEKKQDLSRNQLKYLSEVAEGNRRMVELVNALLNLSRLELGTVAVEPSDVDLGEIVKSVLSELKQISRDRSQTVKVVIADNLGPIKSDPQLVRIILQNLVSNAIKYTPERGKIIINAESVKRDRKQDGHTLHAGTVLLTVKDNGYGIPAPEQNKVFGKLFRATNIRTKNTDGTGLGLYIVKLLCDVLHAKIWFVSSENKGTEFSVVLPQNAHLHKKGTKSLEL